jgi:hypothetical protein
MASGHGYRANRPTTLPLRPTMQSEDSPCQPGAVHTWPRLRDAPFVDWRVEGPGIDFALRPPSFRTLGRQSTA